MTKIKYAEQVNNLCKVIDIAISTLQEISPKGFSQEHIDHFINTYLDLKNAITKAESKFQNSKSLSYINDDIFTYFQEGTGETVNIFWKKIKENNLPYARENRVAKIIKRGKINTQVEYDFIIDVIHVYKEEGIINQEEVNILNNMISVYSK